MEQSECFGRERFHESCRSHGGGGSGRGEGGRGGGKGTAGPDLPEFLLGPLPTPSSVPPRSRENHSCVRHDLACVPRASDLGIASTSPGGCARGRRKASTTSGRAGEGFTRDRGGAGDGVGKGPRRNSGRSGPAVPFPPLLPSLPLLSQTPPLHGGEGRRERGEVFA